MARHAETQLKETKHASKLGLAVTQSMELTDREFKMIMNNMWRALMEKSRKYARAGS